MKKVLDDGTIVSKEIDVTCIGYSARKQLMNSFLKIVEEDNEKFLRRLRHRIDSVLGLIGLAATKKQKIDILQDVSGKVKPSSICIAGEMLVGPAKAFCMDEISTGLDSSTTYQIVKFLRQMVHIMDVTMVISLLQPAPETYNLFDDVILLSEGRIVYQGPRENVLEFFEFMGFRTEMPSGTLADGGKFFGALFFSLINVMFNGMAELAMTVLRLPVFFKQRDFLFYPSWAFALPISILTIPVSLMESAIWIILTYYTIGFAPGASRFFMQFLAFFGIHQMALSLFRFIAVVGRTPIVANTLGSFTLLLVFVLGGFVISKNDLKPWMKWGIYASPMMYGQNAIVMNEFLDKRWSSPNIDLRIDEPTVGKVLLRSRGFFTEEYWFWICVGALFGFSLLFNVLFIAALAFLNPFSGDSKAVGEVEHSKKMSSTKKSEGTSTDLMSTSSCQSSTVYILDKTSKKGMILPYKPLSLAFSHVNYYVDMPAEMKTRGVKEERLQLLQDISGSFRPGVLTALVGVSGAGKTTLMDVLAGRKTGGYIEGSIYISGYPKNQETFTRVCGYCEQNDIHSPNVTVYESLLYSAWLRLSSDVTTKIRKLLLMKKGGQVIYAGPLGVQSQTLIEYLEAVSGVPKIQKGYNPATWMLEVTADSVEAQLDIDFAEIYAKSSLYHTNQKLIEELSKPPPGSQDLSFPTKYSQPFITQCRACFWKQHWSYWRSPEYNTIRLFLTVFIGLAFGVIFWDTGNKIEKQQDLLNLLGAMYAAVLFLGATNASAVQAVVAIERTVFYRERAAGMYSEFPYAFAQVAIETVYVAIQTGIYSFLLYSMMGFEWKAANFFLFYYFIFMCFLYFTMYGMMVVALTPGVQIAAIVMSFFLSFWNLFSGFLIPRPLIPIWWRWYYWASPIAWTIYGLVVSQIGDKDSALEVPGATNVTLKAYLKENLGYDHNFIPVIIVAHIGWVLLFLFVFAYGIKFLNYQRR
uniref:ABC transporter domain-containing protein n=1 Tax=Daucus carota subsp. sativus TaxID=79200 RepID=A0A165ZT11_DAUCS